MARWIGGTTVVGSRRHPCPVSLLSDKDAGDQLLAGDAQLSLSVVETRYSPNRRNRVGIVGIVVVQRTTVARVANPDIVGVPSVGSTERPAQRSQIVGSLWYRIVSL